MLTVVEANLTRNTGYFGKMDPIVVVNYPDATKTKTWSTKEAEDAHFNPKWNESVAVDVKSLGGYLVMKVYDKDLFMDEIIGSTTIYLSFLCKERPVDSWFPLIYKGKQAG